MKIKKIINFTAVSIGLFVLGYACKKTNSVSEQDPAKNIVNSNVRVEKGILVFPNFEVMSKTLDSVNQISDKAKNEWEKNLTFKSARSKFNEIEEILESATNEKNYQELLTSFKSYIIVDNNQIKPVTGNSFFSSIVNEKGIVRVGNDYYRFYNNNETIVLDGSEEKLIQASESKLIDEKAGIIQYDLTSKPGVIAKTNGGETCTVGTLSECLAQTSSRKSFHKLEFSRYIGVYRDPYTYLPTTWIEETKVQLHFSAQKKTLFSWNSYATTYRCNTLDYEDNDGQSIHLTNLWSNGDYDEWYYVLNYKRWESPYDQPLPEYCSPYINYFQCNATSRGTDPVSCTFVY